MKQINPKPTTMPEWEEGWPRVLRGSSAFPLVVQHMPAKGLEQSYDKIGWCPIEIIGLRHFKEAMISYRMHLTYVKQILNNWVQLFSNSPQLQ